MKAVLFDIDGTILTEMPLIQLFLPPRVYEKLSRKFGITREEARERFLSEIFGRRDTYDWHDWNFFFKLFELDLRYEELLRSYPHKLHVYPPDTIPTLEWLRNAGYGLGVVTSGPEYQRLKLRLVGLLDYFDVVVTRDDVNAIKPEPKIFLYALEKLGAEPSEAIMVGDSLSQDVYGAKNLGMTAVWINRDGENGYNMADYEVRSLHELRKILGGDGNEGDIRPGRRVRWLQGEKGQAPERPRADPQERGTDGAVVEAQGGDKGQEGQDNRLRGRTGVIAHLINTDVGNRGVLRVYLDYRRESPNFLHNSAKIFLNNYGRTLVVTGFPIPPAMKAETDGPPGALAIVKAVEASVDGRRY